MPRVAVRILHAETAPEAGPLEQRLDRARRSLAARHAAAFRRAGAEDVAIVGGPSDHTSFGARLRALVAGPCPDGLVVLGSGALVLAIARDLRTFVDVAGGPAGRALANNRYSADIVAVAGAPALLDVPDLPADNALPRWLEEVAGFEIADVRHRWRLGVDLDSPLDLVLVGLAGGTAVDPAHADAAHTDSIDADFAGARARLGAVAEVALDRRAELLVAGRTSAASLGWLERVTRGRVRAFVEERGLRAASPLATASPASAQGDRAAAHSGRAAVHSGPTTAHRVPASALGMLIDRDGPAALGELVARVADAALIDSRVLLAHHFGADERSWPAPEERFASDLLLPDRIADPWLRALTRAALAAPIPIALGGHTLVGPGLRLALRAARSATS